jgi:hypothetical protein
MSRGNPQQQDEQISALSSAFEGTVAYTHPLTDRRQSWRQKQRFVTQMTPWSPGRASVPFEVILEDVSSSGAGVVHDRALEVGLRHLLTVPRDEGEKPVVREYTVVRCDPRPDGKFNVGLELIVTTTAETDDAPEARKGVATSRLKLILLAFSIIWLVAVIFTPL